MGTDAYSLLWVLAIGLGATLFMDLVALFLKRFLRVPSANYCLVGRWLGHMPRGSLLHANIANASPVRLECTVGWISHHVIGSGYAFLFVALVSSNWLARPTLLAALLFGTGTVLVPFYIMQPSFGLGFAAAKAPNPHQARLRSLLAHTAFGVGLYVCAVGAKYLPTIHATLCVVAIC